MNTFPAPTIETYAFTLWMTQWQEREDAVAKYNEQVDAIFQYDDLDTYGEHVRIEDEWISIIDFRMEALEPFIHEFHTDDRIYNSVDPHWSEECAWNPKTTCCRIEF